MEEINSQFENKNFTEQNAVNEATTISEVEVEKELTPQPEVGEPVNDTQAKAKKSTNTKAYGASALMAGVVAAVFVAITMIAGGATNYIVKFISFNVYGTSFDYSINVNFEYSLDDNAYVDFAEVDTGLRMIIVNSTFSKIINLTATKNDENSGVEVTDNGNGKYSLLYNFKGTLEGLKQGTKYKVQVIGDEDGKTVVYAEKEIKTEGGAITRFDDVEWQCNCLTENTFTFKLNYIDENNFYSDFTYSFVRNLDGAEPVYVDNVISDPKSLQVINDVNQLEGSEYVLTIKYLSSAYTDTNDESGQTKVEKTKIINVIL